MSHNPYDAGHVELPRAVSEMFRLRGEVERQAEEITHLRGENAELRAADICHTCEAAIRRRIELESENQGLRGEVQAAERRGAERAADMCVKLAAMW